MTMTLLANSRSSLRDYFVSVDLIKRAKPNEAEEHLSLLLKKVNQTRDFLAAVLFLHRISRVEESTKMYQKALKTALSSADDLGL